MCASLLAPLCGSSGIDESVANGQRPVTSLRGLLAGDLAEFIPGRGAVPRLAFTRSRSCGAATEPLGLRLEEAIEQRLLLLKRMRHRRLFAAGHDEFLVAEDG